MSHKLNNNFVIRIGIFGCVSVGKSTLLNAILRNKYNEVSMRITTKGINHFILKITY